MPSEQHNLSPALKPFYQSEEPNRPIPLYTGTLEVIQEGVSRQGNGVIKLNWFPHPQIEFTLTCNESLSLDSAKVAFKFSEIETSIESLISINERFNSSERAIEISGRVRKPIIIGSGQSLSYLQFHLTNFEDFFGSTVAVIKDSEGTFYAQRAFFEADGWKITIDQLRTTTSSIRTLKSKGGYAITHVGKLERTNKEFFTADESSTILKGLSDFLSFVQGFRIAPMLLIGYDSNANAVWKEWAASNAVSWQNVNSWAWGLTAKSIATAFPGFLNWWNSWGDAAKRAIYWYVESNTQAGAIEGSCVLEQATLELIAWVHLEADFENDSRLLKQERQFKYASQKLNHLFSKQGIPQELPSDLTALIELASSRGWDKTGASVFVKVRNNITHSDPDNRNVLSEIPVAARVEAWELGLWYLELVLLRLFNYQGEYFYRLRSGDRYFGDLDTVPWSASNSVNSP